MSGCCENHAHETGVFEFDVSAVDCRIKHGAVFGALESLGNGDTLRFINDHEALPLLAQIARRYGDQVKVSPVESEDGRFVFDLKIELTPCSGGCGEGACGGHGDGGCGCSGED